MHCSAVISDKLLAANAALKRVIEIVGKAVVDAATENTVRGTVEEGGHELTEAEEEWLRDWHDSQLAPDEVTLGQADAALREHRLEVGGASSTQILFEAQFILAKLKSAKLKSKQDKGQSWST